MAPRVWPLLACWIFGLVVAGCDGDAEGCVAPSSSGDRAPCSLDRPCCDGYVCSEGICTGCPSGDRPCIEGPGLDPDATVPSGDSGVVGDGGAGEGARIVWFSDWRTGAGADRDALYDGGKWTGQLCDAPVAEIVDAAGLDFPTARVYRSTYADPGQCLMVQVTDAWTAPEPGAYLFVRAYYRNAMPDDTTLGFPHPLHVGEGADGSSRYATWLNFAAPSAGASSMQVTLGGGPTYPDQFWSWGFATHQTHRIELRIHRLAEDRATVDVRVHDSAGNLVSESEDWNNGEAPGTPNFRTLAGSRPTFPVTDRSFTLLELGNNDPAGLESAPDRYVYWGAVAVAVGSDPEGWPGPYPTAAEAAP